MILVRVVGEDVRGPRMCWHLGTGTEGQAVGNIPGPGDHWLNRLAPLPTELQGTLSTEAAASHFNSLGHLALAVLFSLLLSS